VPAGVTSVHIVATGGRGNNNQELREAGRVSGDLPVTPNQTLFVLVGGEEGFNGRVSLLL
jgi:hypothetical protein